jgi:hypothetical protein
LLFIHSFLFFVSNTCTDFFLFRNKICDAATAANRRNLILGGTSSTRAVRPSSLRKFHDVQSHDESDDDDEPDDDGNDEPHDDDDDAIHVRWILSEFFPSRNYTKRRRIFFLFSPIKECVAIKN